MAGAAALHAGRDGCGPGHQRGVDRAQVRQPSVEPVGDQDPPGADETVLEGLRLVERGSLTRRRIQQAGAVEAAAAAGQIELAAAGGEEAVVAEAFIGKADGVIRIALARADPSPTRCGVEIAWSGC